MSLEVGLLRFPATIFIPHVNKILKIDSWTDANKILNKIFDTKKLGEKDAKLLAEWFLTDQILNRCLKELCLAGLLRGEKICDGQAVEKSKDELLRELDKLVNGELVLIKYLSERGWTNTATKVYKRIFGMTTTEVIPILKDMYRHYSEIACSQWDSDSGSGLSDCGYPAATTLVQTETGSGPEEGVL